MCYASNSNLLHIPFVVWYPFLRYASIESSSWIHAEHFSAYEFYIFYSSNAFQHYQICLQSDTFEHEMSERHDFARSLVLYAYMYPQTHTQSHNTFRLCASGRSQGLRYSHMSFRFGRRCVSEWHEYGALFNT